jgi:hypothetical protein
LSEQESDGAARFWIPLDKANDFDHLTTDYSSSAVAEDAGECEQNLREMAVEEGGC